MNNEEIKGTIVYIATTRTFTDSFGEEMGIDEEVAKGLADALIAAGLGFMDDDITVRIVATIQRDTHPITMENVALRKRVMEAEHRAKIAEQKYKLLFQKYDSFFNDVTYCHKNFSDVDSEITKQAERELAEEGNK